MHVRRCNRLGRQSSSATPRQECPPRAPPSGSPTSRTREKRPARIARAATPNAPATACTASHWPPCDGAAGAAGAASSAQSTLYRAIAEASRAAGAAVAHRKTRRRKRSAAPPLTPDAATRSVHCSSVCAIVPLYPNDDTPPRRCKSFSHSAARIGADCTGQMANCPGGRLAAATIGLSTRSCALPAAMPRDKRSSMRARPASPAAGSRCPMLALTPPTAAPAVACRQPPPGASYDGGRPLALRPPSGRPTLCRCHAPRAAAATFHHRRRGPAP